MKHIILVISLLVPLTAFSEVSVIVHPSNDSTFSNDDIKSIFLGKLENFPNGKEAVPLIMNNANDFIKSALNKSPKQYKAYWSKMIFTGKGTPPKKANSTEILNLVKDNPNLIGIINSNTATAGVKVVKKY